MCDSSVANLMAFNEAERRPVFADDPSYWGYEVYVDQGDSRRVASAQAAEPDDLNAIYDDFADTEILLTSIEKCGVASQADAVKLEGELEAARIFSGAEVIEGGVITAQWLAGELEILAEDVDAKVLTRVFKCLAEEGLQEQCCDAAKILLNSEALKEKFSVRFLLRQVASPGRVSAASSLHGFHSGAGVAAGAGSSNTDEESRRAALSR
jgi:hypothetical protein